MEPAIIRDATAWNDALRSLPHPHILQSWEWGALKARHGWSAEHWVLDRSGVPRAAALVLKRQLARFPLGLLYVPKGPAVDGLDVEGWDAMLSHLERLARSRRTMFVKIDPDVDRANAAVIDLLLSRGWQPSTEQIQFRNTMTLDLTQGEDALLAQMKSKWRYNIRLAGRRGVSVQPVGLDDLPSLYEMYRETSVRDGFVIRPYAYYRDAWGSFIKVGMAQPFIARVGEQPVAMVIVFRFGDQAWYMYGASIDQHREKMPNHLLQWHAICWAKAMGCTVYDFWGAPEELVESDSMWGVYRFKQGFGARLVQHIGAYDFVCSRFWYWVYTVVMPRMLSLMRRRYWVRVNSIAL